MQVTINSEEAINNPKLCDFIKACENKCSADKFNITHIQSAELIKYSKSMTIAKQLEDGKDYLLTFCGTAITEIYGMDFTGKRVTQSNPEEPAKLFIELFNQVLEENKRIYLTSKFVRDKYKDIVWHQVMMPFWRNETEREVLCYITTDVTKNYRRMLKDL